MSFILKHLDNDINLQNISDTGDNNVIVTEIPSGDITNYLSFNTALVAPNIVPLLSSLSPRENLIYDVFCGNDLTWTQGIEETWIALGSYIAPPKLGEAIKRYYYKINGSLLINFSSSADNFTCFPFIAAKYNDGEITTAYNDNRSVKNIRLLPHSSQSNNGTIANNSVNITVLLEGEKSKNIFVGWMIFMSRISTDRDMKLLRLLSNMSVFRCENQLESFVPNRE